MGVSVESCLLHFSSQLTHGAREAAGKHHAVITDGSLNSQHHPDLGSHGNEASRHKAGYKTALTHLGSKLTGVAEGAEQATQTDL